jgi:hypothetical protein
MKKNYNPINRLRAFLIFSAVLFSIGIKAQTVTLNAVLSGNVTAADAKTDGDLTNLCSTCDEGYIKFDLSSVPVGATITSASLKIVAITPSTTSGSLVNKITSTTLDAATAGTGFYAAAANTAWTGKWSFTTALPVTFNLPINPTGITDLNTSHAAGQITYGVVRGSTNVYTLGGYNNAITSNQPQLVVTYGYPCAGAPTAGTVTAPTAACSGTNFYLGLAGSDFSTGITYQWQSSPNGTVYTNIAGAIYSVDTVSQTASTFYRCIVTCTASGLPSTTNAVNVTMNPFSVCYCASNATNISDEDILNVSVGNISNSSTCTTTGGGSSILNEYSDYTAVMPANLGQSAIIPFSVQVGTCGGNYTNSVAIYIDLDQNGSYADAGENVYLSAAGTNGAHIESGTFTVPAGAMLGNTGMRVISRETGTPSTITPCGTYSYGETEDYIVNITVPPACAQPIGLTAAAITANSANLGWTESGTATAWDIEWGVAGFTPTGTPTIAMASANPTTLNGLAANTSYSFYVRANCGTSTSFWTGPYSFTTLLITCTPSPAIYPTIPFSETFDSTWINICATKDVPTDVWRNSPSSGNNSWRKQDEGATASWQFPAGGLVVPVSSGAASFHSYGAAAGLIGSLDLYVDLSSASPLSLAFDYVNLTGTDSLMIQLSTDGGANFGSVLAGYGTSTWAAQAVSLGVVGSATSVIRFSAISDYGNDDIGIDNVNVLPTASLGIKNNPDKAISIYPNPSNGTFNIAIKNANYDELLISVIDLQGKEVYTMSDKNISADYNKQVDLSGLAKGMYYIKLHTDSEVKVQKLIIQ